MNSTVAVSDLSDQLSADVQAAQQGDLHAFERIVSATQRTVHSIALAVVRNTAASDDIAQDVYLTVWQRLGELRNPLSFLPWLRQTTRNRAINWLRANKRMDDSESAQAKLDETVTVEGAPDAVLENAQNDQFVQDALDRLPEETREVLILFYREGNSIRQVAQLLDLSETAVKQRLSRARKTLRVNVANRLGALLIQTGPGVGFAAMMAATVAPSAKAGIGVAGAGGAKAATKWLLPKTLGSAAGAIAGFLLAIASVVLPWRYEMNRTTDHLARKRLNLFLIASLLALGLVMAGFYWSASWQHWAGPVAVFTLFIAALALLYQVWLPRILRDRDLAQGLSEEQRQHRERIRCRNAWIGWVLGLTTGTGGLIAGLLESGLI